MADLTKQWRLLLVLGSGAAALWLSFSLSNRLSTAQRLAEAKRYLEAKDYAKALPLLQKAAEAGDAGAMKQLGDVYRGGGDTARNYLWVSRDGRGMVQEYAQALAWYQKAAEAGNAEAMYRLVVAYRDGEGVAKDPAQARRWFQKAAEAGNGVAKYHLSQQASK